jgi:tagaturonate reductase
VRSSDFRRRVGIGAPEPALLELPERAVQFGTGAFLRGFVDYFLDEANRRGEFGGRVIAVGSTGSGREQALNAQDGLYTLSTQGPDGGPPRREHRVIASVSRAVSARDDWGEVLACARNPALALVLSNTTEVGIALDQRDDVALEPPRSFPGKLARFLHERSRAFDCDPATGVVVLPCELIEDNGERLRKIVLALATRGRLGRRFARWVETAVTFCNTLVDRIVPGAPPADEAARIQQALGYRDGLITICEVYRLFAIEGDDALRERLRFADADPGIVVTPDIAPYRERKVRLLNGAHTIAAPTALLCGCETVREAVEHALVGRFVRRAMLEEIAPGLDAPGAVAFARGVLDRFANPYIRHALLDITLQQTAKMRVRVVPSVARYAEMAGRAPASLAFGFAGYLLFVRGGAPARPDDLGERVRSHWAALPDDSDAALAALARAVAADVSLWGTDLTRISGFADAVAAHLVRAARAGVPAALEAHLAARPTPAPTPA